MNKTKIIALAAAFSLSLSALSLLVNGDEAANSDKTEYNPENDPLISLSYINEVVLPVYDEKIAGLEEKITTLTETATKLEESLTAANAEIESLKANGGDASQSGGIGQYEVVYLSQGAKLLAKSPCEIILRTGSAIIVSITANGLNDISTGEELLNAVSVPLYHCLLVPRGDDGRGIQITSGDAYVMVRGAYEIVE